MNSRPEQNLSISLLNSIADMDVVFALAYREGVSPVKVSLRNDIPLAGSPEADAILGLTNSSRNSVIEENKRTTEA